MTNKKCPTCGGDVCPHCGKAVEPQKQYVYPNYWQPYRVPYTQPHVYPTYRWQDYVSTEQDCNITLMTTYK